MIRFRLPHRNDFMQSFMPGEFGRWYRILKHYGPDGAVQMITVLRPATRWERLFLFFGLD